MDASVVLAKAAESIQRGGSFSPAFEHDGVMVIPVAYVVGGGGGGEDNRAKPGESRGPATGGAFGMVSIPMGAWVIKNSEVRSRPTFDVAFLLLVASGLLTELGKARRHRKELPN